MEEKTLNEKESIELISRMIRNTQNKLEGDAGIPLLVWGYVSVVVTAAIWGLIHLTGSNDWHFMWFAIPVLGLPLTHIFKRKAPRRIQTYIDRVLGYVWWVLGVACFLFSISSFLVSTHLPILAIVLLLMGSGSLITGLVIKFPMHAIGGAISIVLSIILLFIPETIDNQLLIFIIAFICMSVVPGHVLHNKANSAKEEVENV